MQTSSTVIKNLPVSERPRERLKNNGAGALSISELVAIILRQGTRGVSAIELGNRLLNKFGGLKELSQATIEELSNISEMGYAKAANLKAAFELGKRLAAPSGNIKLQIKNPTDVYNLLKEDMRFLQQEMFKVIILDTKNQVIKIETVTIGILNVNIIHPRELFRTAIKANANSVILVHNHPSGDPEPSKEDIIITKRLIEAGRIVDIDIEDHIIMGDGKYVSMRKRKLI